jgi:K+-sensing histidine kinase KdpD
MVIAIRRLSKNRVIETQIINEFNLNIITTMDETRIIENLEKAARRLLDTEKILFFYLKKDKLIGADFNLDINKLSKKSYEQFFIAKRIFIANFNELKTLKRRLDIKSKAPCIFVPFTIKNKFRGFFVFYAKIKPHMQSVIITRLKFLSNQAALVLEKIELFQALTQALKESDGLQ